MKSFERWASLGSFCLPKFQINRVMARKYFGLESNDTNAAHAHLQSVDRARLKEINGGSGLLDWTVVTDYEKVIRHFQQGLREYALSEDNLSEVRDADGRVINIACNSLGVLYPHLFSSENEYLAWRTEVPALAGKIQHMISEFTALAHRRTLYIMLGSETTAASTLPARMYEALQHLRGPDGVPFELLVCIEEGAVPDDVENISFRRYDRKFDFPDWPWYGCAADWDRMLTGFAHDAP